MASESNIGYATLSIIPNALGFGAALSKGVAPQMAASGLASGLAFGKSLLAGVAVVATAGVAVVGSLAAIGSTFHDMTSTIRVGTGATGVALDGLVASAKNVARGTAASLDDVSKTVTAINVRLGLTGPVLETLSKQFLAAGRITKQALDLNTITGSFNAFGISSADMSGALDQLFQISQATGMGINDLAAAATKGAPAFRQFGLSFGDSAALVGVLDKAGINSGKTIMALTIGLTKFAKEGKAPGPALRETVKSIEAFTKSGEDAKAIALAAGIFGTRGAAQFVAAVKSGKVNLDDMMKSSGASGDSIMAAADAVSGLSGKWSKFMNNVLIAVEPIATRVFNALNSGLKFMIDVGIPGLEKFGGAIADVFAAGKSGGLDGALGKIGALISAAWPGVRAKLGELLSALGSWITDTAWPAIRKQLAKWGTAFWEWIQPQIVPALEKLGILLGALGTWVLNVGLPWLGEHLKTWGTAFWEWIQPMIGPFLLELGKLLGKFWIWSETVALPAIYAKLAEWAWAFIKWVPGAAFSLLMELDKLMAKLVIWMATVALPAVVVQLGKWALAFVEWIPGVAIVWNTLFAPMFRFVLDGIGSIIGGISNMLLALGHVPGFGWATDAGTAMQGAAAQAHAMADGIKDIPDKKDVTVTARFTSVVDNATQALAHSVGSRAVPGYAQGGIVPATPGGRLVRVAEAGRDEAIVPLPRNGAGMAGVGGGPSINVYPTPGLSEQQVGIFAAHELAWAMRGQMA